VNRSQQFLPEQEPTLDDVRDEARDDVQDDGLEGVRRRIRSFRDEREWMQFHNPKNLAASIVIEAGELLELFQWTDMAQSEAVGREKKQRIGEEIADVAVYLIELADNLGIDLVAAIHDKMDANARKYPVEKAKGRSEKYDEL
jgi:dCTP diphosphatase